MPLTLTLAEGILPAGQETVAFQRLSDAMIRWHGLTGNSFITPNITGTVHVLPAGHTFAGSVPTPVAFVEWKTPAFAFADRAVQQGYIREATDIIHDMSGGRQPREAIFVNVVHAVDGAWGVAGEAMTNAEMAAAAAAAAAPQAA